MSGCWLICALCTGLAAASAQLARIYDMDGGDAGPIRPSATQADYPRASFAFEGTRSYADTGAGAASTPGSPTRRHPPALSQPQTSQTYQGPLQPQPSTTQHFLGAHSRGTALSSLQRSTSRAVSTNSTVAGTATGGPGSVRDQSGRGTEGMGLARRTRFADSNTAVALARASASGILYHQQQGGC